MSAAELMLELLAVGAAALGVRRFARRRARTWGIFAIKLYLTVRVFWLILLHEVEGETIIESLGRLIRDLDLETFVLFTLTAMVVRMVGVGASITRWALMLRGQSIALPALHVIGAFLPSCRRRSASTATSSTTRRASAGARSRSRPRPPSRRCSGSRASSARS
jgi:hypothetical protein